MNRHAQNPAGRTSRCLMPPPKNTCLKLFIATLVAVGFWVLDASSLAGGSASIEGRVVGVHDGDSATLLTHKKSEVKIRLEGIDAPELKQPFGTVSKQALSNLIFGKDVSVRVTGRDRYGRTLGRISVGATDINHAMVAAGMAWHYEKYSKDPKLAAAQVVAITARRGLWGGSTPVPPWEWRKSPKAK
jgi:micrococcal nuclease